MTNGLQCNMMWFVSVEKPQDLLGAAVISKCGRDVGRPAFIVGWSAENTALIADGKLRTVERPKKKNIRHISFTKLRHFELHKKLSEGEPVTNRMIREGLAAYGEQIGAMPQYG